MIESQDNMILNNIFKWISVMVLLLIFSIYTAKAQTGVTPKIKLGPEMNESTTELSASDDMLYLTKYYKNLKVDLKKGESAVFYMIARDFDPLIYRVSTDFQYWNSGISVPYAENSKIAYVPVKALTDTSYYIFYTSNEAKKTGVFAYGMRKLNPSQLQYNAAANVCDRVNYLINHWQCFWSIIPLASGSDSLQIKTYNCLLPGDSAYLTLPFDYQETFYLGNEEKVARKNYGDIVLNLSVCFNKNILIPESKLEKDSITGFLNQQTFFTLRDGYAGQTLKSFKIELNKDIENRYRVFIRFY